MSRRTRKPPGLRDWHLWTEVTRSVSPLHPEALAREIGLEKLPDAEKVSGRPSAPPQPVHAKKPTAPSRPSYRPPTSAPRAADGFGDKIIEPKLHRKLRRGHLPIDATIDLHGLRQEEAHAALCRFIAARFARGDRTVLVITGKGLKKTGFGQLAQKGVLRAMLPLWLSEKTLAPMIAGWENAARDHGGEGAFYVRLKRAKP